MGALNVCPKCGATDITADEYEIKHKCPLCEHEYEEYEE